MSLLFLRWGLECLFIPVRRIRRTSRVECHQLPFIICCIEERDEYYRMRAKAVSICVVPVNPTFGSDLRISKSAMHGVVAREGQGGAFEGNRFRAYTCFGNRWTCGREGFE